MADNEAGIEAADAAEAVARAFRDEWGRVVATLIGMTGDWDLAEECAQEAFAQALRTWPRDGVPRKPGAWLTTTARNRALDRLRRRATETARLRDALVLSPPEDPAGTADDDESGIADDRLRLIFTCCHPALPLEARVALTLRTLAGLTHGRDRPGVPGARADHGQAPGPGQAQDPRCRHPLPGAARAPAARADRRRAGRALPAVQRGLRGQLGRRPGPPAAVRRGHPAGRVLGQLMPGEPETAGVLALMLFHDARRDARVDADGELITLEDQDRARWNRPQIEEADAILQAALRRGPAGPYLIQAAIAACHATAPRRPPPTGLRSPGCTGGWPSSSRRR